jgi:hypothetical protein
MNDPSLWEPLHAEPGQTTADALELLREWECLLSEIARSRVPAKRVMFDLSDASRIKQPASGRCLGAVAYSAHSAAFLP